MPKLSRLQEYPRRELTDSWPVGPDEGSIDGAADGRKVGSGVGRLVGGRPEGPSDGLLVGEEVGHGPQVPISNASCTRSIYENLNC